jgi:hypothetical protein
MNCDQIKPEIQGFYDGELHGRSQSQIRHHINECDACRSEFAALRRLSAEIRDADYIADVTVATKEPRKHRLVKLVRLTLAICIVAVLSALWLHLPHRPTKSDPNAAVAAALNGVQTWHLSGWKQIDGRHVPWDIWGRRQPYLSYEKIGQNVTIDDGTTKRLILAPNQAFGRPDGLVIVTSDETATDSATKLQQAFAVGSEPDVHTMVDGWDWLNGGGMFAQKPFKQSKDELSFRRECFQGIGGVNNNHVYTISKHSWLPIRYEFVNRSDKGEWITEQLSAGYGVDLPVNVAHPSNAMPPGFTVADFTGTKAVPAKRDDHTYDVGPFHVTGTLLAMDTRGNAIVETKVLLNGLPLGTPESSVFSAGTAFPDEPYIHGDNRGVTQRYLYINSPFPADGNGVSTMFVTPLDDIKSISQLSDRIGLNPTLNISILDRDSDTVGEDGSALPRNSGESLIQTHLPMAIAMSSSKQVRDIETQMPGDWKNYIKNHGLNETIYQTRAWWHYMSSQDGSIFSLRHQKDLGIPISPNGEIDLLALHGKPLNVKFITKFFQEHQQEINEIKKSELTKAVYWQQKSLDSVSELPPSQRLDAITNNYRALAMYYRAAGDKQAMNRMLKAELRVYERTESDKSLDIRQIEYEIKTGILVGETGWAGPM